MVNEDSPMPVSSPAQLPVAVWRGRDLATAVEVARRLRQEGVPCAVSGHPEPWWTWQGWVFGRNRVMVDPDRAAEAREMLKVLSHLDDAMAFETPDHRRPNPWPMVWRVVGLLLLLAFLSAAVGWRFQW